MQGEKMAKPVQKPAGWVKKETSMVMVFVALLIGFVSGVAFSVYRSDSGLPAPDPAARQRDSELAAKAFTLSRQLDDHPENAAMWAELGNLYFDLHELEKAIGAYHRSLAVEPANADVWTDLGVMYRRSGQPEKAIESFDKAVAVDSRHEISRLNKGIVLLHDFNDKEGALRAWEALLEINPVAVAPNGQPVEELVRSYKNQAATGS
jgi:cytochrome c-type biogenesis protein CcmH/NrfG